MKRIITAFSIITILCSCSTSKETTITTPEVPEKPAAPRNVNNFPVK